MAPRGCTKEVARLEHKSKTITIVTITYFNMHYRALRGEGHNLHVDAGILQCQTSCDAPKTRKRQTAQFYDPFQPL